MDKWLRATSLCRPCARIFAFDRKPIENEFHVNDKRTGDETTYYKHFNNTSDLRQSAERGRCRLCSILWNNLSTDDQTDICRPYDTENGVVGSIYVGTFQTSYRICPLEVQINGWTILFQLPRPGESLSLRLLEQLRSRPEDLGGGALDSTTLSVPSLNLVARWVNTCNREHATCQAMIPVIPSDISAVPTRLIEVGDHDNPILRLVYTKDIPPNQPYCYLALTHRWGELKFTCLLTTNHAAFLTSIPYDELTATFKDMVNIARIIKAVNYIWIDSLCIIQDSKDDWCAESVRMQDVYSNALFTVAAAHALDGRDGCESWRDPGMLAPLVARFARPQTWRTMLASLFPPMLPTDPRDGDYVCVDPGTWRREVDESPVACRAWVAQGRFLSRRVIFCGRTQLFYACAELRACESYPLGCPASVLVEDVFTEGLAALRRLSLAAQQRPQRLQLPMNSDVNQGREGSSGDGRDGDTCATEQRLPQEDLLGVWCRLVESYTALEIKVFSDKLPAISGIAQRFAPYMGPSIQYSAGLWTDYSSPLTTAQLLWFIEQPVPRPEDCKAPTWSWASVASPVLDPANMEEGPSLRYNPLALCLDPVQLDLEGNSRFGSVKKGVIWLRAKLFSATLRVHDYEGRWGTELVLETRGCYGQLGAFSSKLDTSDVDVAGPLVCATIQEIVEAGEFVRLDGMILRPMDGPEGRYQRVGLFWTDEEEFWKELTKPITDAEAETMWYQKRIESSRGSEYDTYLFSIE